MASARLVRSAPNILVASHDESLHRLAAEVGGRNTRIEINHDLDSALASSMGPRLKVVLIDGAAVERDACERGILRVKNLAPHAFLVYVAGEHDAQTEQWARTLGVHYYCARPCDSDRLGIVMKSFLEYKHPAASGSPRKPPRS
jgi:DNA-binding NtrC family response regulator